MSNALIGTGALISGGQRKAAGSYDVSRVAQTASSQIVSEGGRAYRSVPMASGGNAIIRPGVESSGIKKQLPTDDERHYYSRIRKTRGGDVMMVPKVVGKGIANSKPDWVGISDGDTQARIRVFRDVQMEAAILVWNGEQVPNWMLWAEGKELVRPNETAASTSTPISADEPLIKSAAQQQRAPAPLSNPAIGSQPAEVIDPMLRAENQRLQQQVAELQGRLQEYQVKENALEPHRIIIEIDGFGEVETTADWYKITDNVLTLAYDIAKQRNVMTPRPKDGHAVSQFVLELHDGDKRHLFDLVATYNSKVDLDPAGRAGLTIQQFMIARHQEIKA